MLEFGLGGGRLRTVLFLGARCDGIEIGCGGTALRLIAANSGLEVHWTVFSSESERALEARRAAELFLEGAGERHVEILEFRNSCFSYVVSAIKERFDALKARVSPDVVFTHYGKDLHQDHNLLPELAWNALRGHLILEYEIPKGDGGLGSPIVFVNVDAETLTRKIAYQCYGSQRSERWFTAEPFLGLMRLRGVECNAPHGYAEVHHGRKLCLRP